MSYYLDAILNYANFSGKATRREYWMFVMFNTLIGVIIYYVETLILKSDTTIASSLYQLFMTIPGIAIGVRRLHDSGHSGFWIFINIIPFLGGIIFLIFLFLPSENTEHNYGYTD